MRYNIGDTIKPIDRLGYSYTVVARYYCQSDISRSTWVLHANDTLPVFDYCLINCDTAILTHLLITHCDIDGIIPCEAYLDRAIGYDALMPISIVCCHPKQAKQAYPFWTNLIMGDWSTETLVTYKDGMLYVCRPII